MSFSLSLFPRVVRNIRLFIFAKQFKFKNYFLGFCKAVAKTLSFRKITVCATFVKNFVFHNFESIRPSTLHSCVVVVFHKNVSKCKCLFLPHSCSARCQSVFSPPGVSGPRTENIPLYSGPRIEYIPLYSDRTSASCKRTSVTCELHFASCFANFLRRLQGG